MTVIWVGDSELWRLPRWNGGAFAFVFPLTEDAVLRVAHDPQYKSKRRLSRDAALRCTSRYLQRKALDFTGLNPRWRPVELFERGSVFKTPASTLSQGVHHVPRTWDTARLARYDADLARFGVVEEYVEGEQYEVNGVVVGGRPRFFQPVSQVWRQGYIARYERVVLPGMETLVTQALRAVGLDDCPFCVELRHDGHRWYVIEVNARLGEDDGLAEAMSDGDPLEEIERAVEEGSPCPA